MKPFRNIITDSYWGKLFQKDKFLFAVVFLFFFFSILANIIRLETSPFFVWNLYSDPYYPQTEYTIYEVRYNDKLLNIKHTWQAPKQVFLREPLHYYLFARNSEGTDYWQDYLENYWARKHPAYRFLIPQLYSSAAQYHEFPLWYKKYISDIKNEEIKAILVLKKRVRFENSGRLSEVSSDTALLIQ